MMDFVKFVAPVLIVTCLFVAGLLFAVRVIEESDCKSFSKVSGRETMYVKFPTGSTVCMTPAEDGKWIDVRNLRSH